MSETKIPSWWVDVGLQAAEEVYGRFRWAVSEMPLSQREIATQLGVDQTTVSRWARGRGDPTLEEMVQAISLIAQRTEELHSRTSNAAELLAAVQSVLEAAAERRLTRSDSAARPQREAFDRLQELLRG